jgi:protein phosphatase
MSEVEIVSRTDVGLIRDHNEDRLAVFPEKGLVLLADGMGGYNAGEVASQLVIDTVSQQLISMHEHLNGLIGKKEIVSAIELSNLAIFDAVEENSDLNGMGTTLVLAVFHGQKARFAHIGDSRLYRYRNGDFKQLTSDHSMLQELIDQGVFGSEEEAMDAGVPSSVLTRGLGIEYDIKVDFREEEVQDGDIYLLCSDGLSGMIPDEAIYSVLDSLSDDLSGAADLLTKLALDNGGRDNISLILVHCRDGK